MTLNPLKFSQQVNEQYLRYQLTEHRLTDPVLGDQLRDLLWRPNSPLIKGPYVSISRAFEEGRSVKSLVQDRILHPKMAQIIPYPTVYRHQEEALRAIHEGKDVLITTGTGSGKTESFLYPILNRILRAEEQQAKRGVMALIVYPMNALATDQLERLREMLVGSGISFGMYTGDTPEARGDAEYAIKEAPQGATREVFEKLLQSVKQEKNAVLHPHEERFTRKDIRQDPPRILLTNTRMLEYLLTRSDDLEFLADSPLEFIVMDEAHTNSGAMGAEVALLMRRVKSLVQGPEHIRHLAASATIADQDSKAEGQRFLGRLLGCDPQNVEMVWESHQDLAWDPAPLRGLPPRDALGLYERTLAALGIDDEQGQAQALEAIYQELTNHPLEGEGSVAGRIHDGFLRIDFARSIYEAGSGVASLDEQIREAWEHAGRGAPRPDQDSRHDARWEYLTYLALGAAAVKDDTPILRPKLHFFVKGLEDASVVFCPPRDDESRFYPELFLSPEEAKTKHPNVEPSAIFPVRSCPRCGQHHYEQHVQVAEAEDGAKLSGGTQVEGGAAFHADAGDTMARILFTDSILQESGDYGDDQSTAKHTSGRLCRFCGALHTGEPKRCGSCERDETHQLVPIQILDSMNKVSTCPVCKYGGGRGREDPFRALTENTARNVYIMAQDMLSLADPEGRKLILFADNRQDAAFQAGSMRDNSRLFRLRQMLYQYLPEEGSTAIQPIVDALQKTLLDDQDLARFVAPEVYQAVQERHGGSLWQKEMKRFLSIQVLNELARPYTDRRALESLGRLSVQYAGLSKDNEAIQDLAHKHGLEPSVVAAWLEVLLHQGRRKELLTHDLAPDLFTESRDKTRRDLSQNKYLPGKDFRPGGWVLEKRPEQKGSKAKVQAFIGPNSAVEEWAKAGLDLVDSDTRQAFLKDAWTTMFQEKWIRLNAKLTWSGGKKRIPGAENTYHVDGQAIRLAPGGARFQCVLCKRLHGHATPRDACTTYRCKGKVEPMDDAEEPRDYDQVLLEQRRGLDSFVMAEEHTAQVPKERRQLIERRFKRGQGVNTLVATPTLELGVDIGPLDMVLMRNVPPTSANYWQRAGRAGRRNRMAVVYSYARNNNHDIHFYKEPKAMLQGAIEPPRFNLRNPVMVRKHVHAYLLTHFQRKMKGQDANWVPAVFPKHVGDALFLEGRLLDNIEACVAPFRAAVADDATRVEIVQGLRAAFQTHWPDDPGAVADELLEHYVQQAPDMLLAAYRHVWNRIRWAQRQLGALAAREADGITLTDEEERFQKRCRALVRAYNPTRWVPEERRHRGDVSYTLKVLATEGYLPGYATSVESVTASAPQAFSPGWERFEFELTRNATVAIREHIPGNRLYANGGKYRLTNYMFPADEDARAPTDWYVDPETFAVRHAEEVSSTDNRHGWIQIKSLPLVDSTLTYIHHVEADEKTRYRVSSQVSGIIRATHGGGLMYKAGERTVEHRRGQAVTLVNLGPTRNLEEAIGYPICHDCGAVRSPFDDERGIQHFVDHHEKIHGRKPALYGLHVHATVDGLLFRGLADAEAASLAEAIRLAASAFLDMERDDLDWFVQGTDEDTVALFVYDAMPGGSGLLHQLIDQWSTLQRTAGRLLSDCPGACSTSCYHCLKTYFNQFWHDQLDRKIALETLQCYKDLNEASFIEPGRTETASPEDEPTNKYEQMLEHTLVKTWGLTGFNPQGKVQLTGCKIPYTKPDFVHEAAKIAVYLDGPYHWLSIQTIKTDKVVRFALEDAGWLVIEVPIGDLSNAALLQQQRERIAHRLGTTREAIT